MRKSFLKDVFSFFAFFSIVFIPFPFSLTRIQLPVTEFVFGNLIDFTAKNIFGTPLTVPHIISDSVSLYILVLLLFILAVIMAFLLPAVKQWPRYRDRVLTFFYKSGCCYLSLLLLKYGVDKIFKNQFYLPEPNTLFTPLGKMSKGMLYWSSMGTSYFYNVFLGSLEVLAAVFIFFKRTRLVGLLMSLVIMLNVVAVNFGFDISVKLYSLFLLFLTIYLLAPYFRLLYHFMLFQRTDTQRSMTPDVRVVKNPFLSASLKWFIAGIILLEALYPFGRSGNFNNDLAKRPYLHGAYEVKTMIAGTDTMDAAHSTVKRFFIHKDSYMIFQDQEDKMNDYKLGYDLDKYIFVLTDYQMHKTILTFSYRASDSILTLRYFKADKEYQLTGKAIDWRKLPTVQKGFHWTIEGN